MEKGKVYLISFVWCGKTLVCFNSINTYMCSGEYRGRERWEGTQCHGKLRLWELVADGKYSLGVVSPWSNCHYQNITHCEAPRLIRFFHLVCFIALCLKNYFWWFTVFRIVKCNYYVCSYGFFHKTKTRECEKVCWK